jgi:GT2 family glycosyltransferase
MEEALVELQGLVGGRFPGFATYFKPDNEGFSKTVNVGLRTAIEHGDDAVLINADIEFFEPGWLEAMQAREEAVVGALLMYPNGLIQHAGIFFSLIYRSFNHIHQYAPHTLTLAQEPRICPVTAALQFIRHDTLRSVGLYDEGFRLGWEDVDYCHRVFQAGLKCVYEPKARAVHHEGLFRQQNPSKKIQDWQMESWTYLHEKHSGHSFADYIPTLIGDDW